MFDVLKSSPVEYGSKNLEIYQNKVMLNEYDNCRTYDFDFKSTYNVMNRGNIPNLIYVKFKPSKIV